jgi:P4 family phage/plasmid primase-like protien
MEMLERAWGEDSDCGDKIMLYQEFQGISRLGLAPRFQKVLLFYGVQANDGKSTLAAIQAKSMPPGSVSKVRPEEMADQFSLAPMASALLNIADEVGTKPIDRIEIFKEVVTAKIPVKAEKKGKDPFLFLPRAGHLILGNHFPTADDFTNGFFRRFVVIGFNRSVPDADINLNIEEEIVRDECEAIVRWSLEGAARALKNGRYTIPASSRVLAEEWRANCDQVHAFIHDQFVETDNRQEWVKLKQLYAQYVRWADEKGHRRVAESTFGNRSQRWRVETREGNYYRLQAKEDQVAVEREQRNQRIAEEVLSATSRAAIELDSEEERRTDYLARKEAEKYLDIN